MRGHLYILNGVTFTWDVQKAAANIRKHKISFEEAREVFFDPFLISVDASRNDEDRNAIIGYTKSSQLLYVVYIEKEDDAFRIISALKATKQHRKTYENY